MEVKFYICKHCGNIIAFVKDKGVPVVCCGEKMSRLEANSVDAAVEKHVPVVAIDKNKVKVEIGSTAHPMTQEHYIEWVCLQSEQGNQRKCLNPGDKPYVEFLISDDDKVEAVYAYCNLHGLWKN